MPFRRRRSTRRRFNRRPRNKPNLTQVKFPSVGGMTVPQMARYGALGYNILKGLINSELKRFDTTSSGSVSTTVTITNLCAVTQGDDVSNRNGNKILAKYITMEYTLVMDVTAPNSFVRVMIVVDTENAGSAPNASDILQDTTPGNSINARINVDYTQRFTVLYDKVHTMSNTGSQNVYRKMYRGLNFHINYISSAGSSQNKNSIWLVYVSDEASATPTINYTTRLAFYDN